MDMDVGIVLGVSLAHQIADRILIAFFPEALSLKGVPRD